LHRFLQRHPLTAVRLLGALSEELASARQKTRDLALKGAESRLASLLLRLVSADGAPDDGQRVALPYTRRELAEMVGVSTETAIRLLARLKKKKAIDTNRRDLVVIDAEKLQRIANTDNVAAR
jgi:CRP-like cAMP-binding protein